MKYRPEIDGLRTVAVLPVILFHAGASVFSGGYVGVDVFFVISGYLITTILISELAEERFSILRFYERRARRILPALCVVLLACLPFAYFWMLPKEFEDFAQSLMAVVIFASNILFWRESGYFAPAAENKPLLHTWSLAVEEQYYLFFPLLLWLLWRFGRNPTFAVVCIMAALSLAVSQWGSRAFPSANFYLIPTRAWELFAGSICAFILAGTRPLETTLLRQILSGAGLTLIVGSIFVYDANTPFPSLYALVPVAGSMLIILHAAPGTAVARLLSTRSFVGIGLISYSAYLWHQPLFAFARLRDVTSGHPPQALMFVLAALSLVLAWATWAFVEQPFRRKTGRWLDTRLQVFGASCLAGATIMGLGYAGYVNRGFPERLNASARAALSAPRGDSSGCYDLMSAADIRAGARCGFGATGVAPSIAVIGDSHASRMTDALGEVFAAYGRGALAFNGGWCAPMMDFGTTNPNKRPECRDEINAAFAQVFADPDLTDVVLIAQWPNYTLGYRFGDNRLAAYTFGDARNTDIARNPDYVEAALDHTLARLTEAGKTVVIMSTVPEYRYDVPSILAKRQMFDAGFSGLGLSLADYRTRNAEVTPILEGLTRKYNVPLIDGAAPFCGGAACRSHTDEGLPLYEDSNHPNLIGARRLAPAITRALRLEKVADAPSASEKK